MKTKPNVVALECNFARLKGCRYLHSEAKNAINIMGIDRKNYINFQPNIPIEVFNNNSPADNLECIKV